jgi:endoglucanase
VIDRRPIDILAEIARTPATSFHEHALAVVVARIFRDLGLAPLVDSFGNLIAHYHVGEPKLSVALVAHLDHPGVEIITVESDSVARAVLLGGVRPAYFTRPVPLILVRGGGTVPATSVGLEVNPTTGRVNTLQIRHAGNVSVGDFGVFDVTAYEETGSELVLRAADDLVGVAALLATLERLVASRAEASVYGVLTRAEEVGLIGADAVAAERALPADVIVISLECSARRPGAEPGQGPVIRVGDRTQSFHPDGETLLRAARARLPNVSIQRQLMDGGTCEATAFLRRGYRATGVAVPLTNYHNMGPDDAIAAERVNRDDLLGEVSLLVEACTIAGNGLPRNAPGGPGDESLRERLIATAPAYQSLAG